MFSFRERHLLNQPRESHKQRQRCKSHVEHIIPPRRKFRFFNKHIRRIIHADPIDHVPGVSCESMIKSHYLACSFETCKPLLDQLLRQLGKHGFELRDAKLGEVRIQRLSALAMQVMVNCRDVRVLEINHTIDKAIVAVCGPDGARDVELIVVIRVADGELPGTDSDDWSCMSVQSSAGYVMRDSGLPYLSCILSI